MELSHALILALVQGLTEFLPISSSAHLILIPVLTGWTDQGLAFDVAVHVGTLGAVVLYFRATLARVLGAWWRSLWGGGHDADSRLAWFVAGATVPAALAGLVFHDLIEAWLRGPLVIAVTTVGFGLLLGWADRVGRGRREEGALTWRDALWVGLAQALALIPGTSRSGITITAGLALGLSRSAAARFSFLLSIPLILLAGGYEALGLITDPAPVDWAALAVGVAASGVSAYLCIHFFLRLVERIGLLPFVLYRLVLGAFLWVVFS